MLSLSSRQSCALWDSVGSSVKFLLRCVSPCGSPFVSLLVRVYVVQPLSHDLESIVGAVCPTRLADHAAVFGQDFASTILHNLEESGCSAFPPRATVGARFEHPPLSFVCMRCCVVGGARAVGEHTAVLVRRARRRHA